jgi:hypothetical protein
VINKLKDNGIKNIAIGKETVKVAKYFGMGINNMRCNCTAMLYFYELQKMT